MTNHTPGTLAVVSMLREGLPEDRNALFMKAPIHTGWVFADGLQLAENDERIVTVKVISAPGGHKKDSNGEPTPQDVINDAMKLAQDLTTLVKKHL